MSTASASAAGLTGAGSTLVAPLMANWINGFEIKEGIPVKYGAVGSGDRHRPDHRPAPSTSAPPTLR